MCERKAENYSAGTSLVIISYPRRSLPEMVEPAGTLSWDQRGLMYSVKETDLEMSTEFPDVQYYFWSWAFSVMKILHVALSSAIYDLSLL